MADYVEEEIIEEEVVDEPKPGLLILDMSNDQVKAIEHNKATMIENCRNLALSDFFHVAIDSKPIPPKFRATAPGVQLVDELKSLEHINHVGKKKDSALDGTEVLQTFKDLGITHVCVCGTSTDTSVYETAKDLVANGFDIFVVSDATSSKSGKLGHVNGLNKIKRELGANVVVGIDDLLGDEEEVIEEEVVEDEEGWVEEVVDDEYEEEVVSNQPRAPAPYLKAGGGGGLSPEEQAARDKAEALRQSDAAKLAARKKDFDANRFGHINKTNAEVNAKKAATGGAPVNTGKVIKQGPSSTITTESAPALGGSPAPAPSPAAAAAVPAAATPAPAKAEKSKPAPKEKKRRGWGIFGRKKKEKEPAPVAAPAPAPVAAPAPAPPPAPAPAPVPAPAPEPLVKVTPPVSVHPMSAPDHPPATSNPNRPKTWKGQGETLGTFKPAGAAPNTTGAKKMVAGNAVSNKIQGLQSQGMRTTNAPQRRMKTPKVVTDVKETWDKQGNITREITRYITEIDGTKRTEKSTEYVPAK